MFCTKCQNDLSKCACPDLKERLEKLYASSRIYFHPVQRSQLDKLAEKNKTEKIIQE